MVRDNENNDGKFMAAGLGGAAVGAVIANLLKPSPVKASEEGITGGVFTLDETTRQAIAATLLSIRRLEVKMDELTQAQGVSAGKMNYIPFQYTMVAGQAVRLFEDKPLIKGIIRSVQINWPDGCNSLVDVAVWYGNVKQLVPLTGTNYLALNDASPIYNGINQEKLDSVQLWVDMRNRDAFNPHTIVVTIAVEVEV